MDTESSSLVDEDDAAENLTTMVTKGENEIIDHLHCFVEMDEMKLYCRMVTLPMNRVHTLKLNLASPSSLSFTRLALQVVKSLQSPENQIRRLELSGRKTFKLDPILRALKHDNSKLEELVLQRFLFDYDRMVMLSDSLTDPKCAIYSLELSDINLVGEEMMRALMKPVSSGKIQVLRLISNDIRSLAETSEIAKALHDDACRVKHLSLDGNKLSIFGLLTILASASPQTLRTLSINHVTMPETGLGHFLQHFHRLSALAMQGGSVQDADVVKLPLESLERLNLNENASLGPDGIVSLCVSLRTAGSFRLRQLHLGEVNIGDDGLEALGMLLRHPGNVLEWLDVMNQCVWRCTDPEAERFFLEALEDEHNRLEELFVSLDHLDSIAILGRTMRSRNNRLHRIGIHCSCSELSAEREEYVTFAREVRRSRMRKALFARDIHANLSLDFNSEWFQVLMALLGSHSVPRLSRDAFVRILPVSDFAVPIAETLGWPLDQLRF